MCFPKKILVLIYHILNVYIFITKLATVCNVWYSPKMCSYLFHSAGLLSGNVLDMSLGINQFES
jgi:hypothetical protein